MIAIERSISPAVFETEGDGFNVQFTNRARRSEKSQTLVVQRSRCRSDRFTVPVLLRSRALSAHPIMNGSTSLRSGQRPRRPALGSHPGGDATAVACAERLPGVA